MKKYLAGLTFIAILTLSSTPTPARAETSDASLSSMLELLQSLMKQVEALKAQLAELRGEIKDEIRDGLREGVSDEDVKKIQEILATDPTIYPKGLVSGYYGPLTKEAVMRFQNRHGLEPTGEVDAETKRLFHKYLKEKRGGKYRSDLLKKANDHYKKPEMKDKKEDHKKDVAKTEAEAEAAVEEASEYVTDLEEALEADEDHQYADYVAQKLQTAQDYLEYAEEYLDAGKFNDAYHKAQKIKSLAKEGLAKLEM